LYRIKGSELDAETRKEINGADRLNAIQEHDDEIRVHMWLFIIGAIIMVMSALCVPDAFAIDMIESLRSEKFGWEPALCTFEESEKRFHPVLICPLILHALVLLWWVIRAACKIKGDHFACYQHPALYILLANCAVTAIGLLQIEKIDAEIAVERCGSSYSISAIWFRIDFVITFASILEDTFDEWLLESK
jgi:hypothetical protein